MTLFQAELNQNDEALKNLVESLKLENDFLEALDAKWCILTGYYKNLRIEYGIWIYLVLLK